MVSIASYQAYQEKVKVLSLEELYPLCSLGDECGCQKCFACCAVSEYTEREQEILSKAVSSGVIKSMKDTTLIQVEDEG